MSIPGTAEQPPDAGSTGAGEGAFRVLYLTQRLPYAPNRGDRIRAHHVLRVLQGRATVDLVSLAQEPRALEHLDLVRPLVASCRALPVRNAAGLLRSLAALLGGRPLTHALLDAPGRRRALEEVVASRPPDVVLASGSGMARWAFEPPLAGRPLVLDLVDVDSGKWLELAAALGGLRGVLYRREARVLWRFERRAAAAARATVVVSDRERRTWEAQGGGGRLEVVGNGIDAPAFRPPGPPSPDPVVIFSGVLRYEPNVLGIVRFAREAWPLVRRERPDARLRIVGRDPVRAVRRLAADPSIDVPGTVPEIAPHLWGAALAVAPLGVARGTQNKVLEAVAAGLPCVITPEVAAGLPGEVLPACAVAAAPADLAAAVLRLLGTPPGERRARTASIDLGALAWEVRLRPLVDLLAAAAG